MTSMSPLGVRPSSREGESRRRRLALACAAVGIAATLLAYAVSPGVRHAVGHAAHSVKHAVGHVLDRDHEEHPRSSSPARPAAPAGAKQPAPAKKPAPAKQSAVGQEHTKTNGG
jgi:hypothetical protein